MCLDVECARAFDAKDDFHAAGGPLKRGGGDRDVSHEAFAPSKSPIKSQSEFLPYGLTLEYTFSKEME